MSLKGIDISAAQDIDVSGLSVDFVVIKATGGTGYVNNKCDTNYQQAKNAGKLKGVYHYYSDVYGGADPIAEADWFVNNIQGYINDSILVLDWERCGNPYVGDVSKAKAFLDHVQARTGVKPLIYMSASLVSELDWSSVIAGDYGLWVAAYTYNNTPINNFNMPESNDPNPSWGAVGNIMWQFTSTGQIPGYSGNLDCDYFYGDSNTWHAYQTVPTASTPEPITPPVVPEPPIITPPVVPEPPVITPPVVIPPINVIPTPVVPETPDLNTPTRPIAPIPVTPVLPPKKNWLVRFIMVILNFFDIIPKGRK